MIHGTRTETIYSMSLSYFWTWKAFVALQIIIVFSKSKFCWFVIGSMHVDTLLTSYLSMVYKQKGAFINMIHIFHYLDSRLPRHFLGLPTSPDNQSLTVKGNIHELKFVLSVLHKSYFKSR